MWYYQLKKGVPIFYTGTQILLPRVSERIDIMQDMKTSKIKLNEASEVEEFVKAAGKCDFVALGRQQFADRNFAIKL